MAIFLDKYGLPTVLVLLLLTNIGKIATFAERLLSKAWPTFAEHRRLRLERAIAADKRVAEQQRSEVEKTAAAEERIDTILALKDMLLSYRQALDGTNLERRQLQNRLFELVEQYEHRDAQIIEVLKDISTAIRSQTERLDRITVKMGMYNAENRTQQATAGRK